MPKLKPTILIALDRYATAFCQRVQCSLERELAYSGSLIKSYALVLNGKAPPAIAEDLAAFADFSFTLPPTGEANGPTGEEIRGVLEAGSFELEPELSEIIEAGRRYVEIQKAHDAGLEIAQNRVIYLVLSAADCAASNMIIELTRLIRWLFATRFPQELYELHAVVLLPNLFERATQTHFAAAYALLKKLDHALLSGLAITALRKMPPFDGCWLIDGINARGETIGTLNEQLDSYTDAFTGFLTAEPEMSGALVGARTARGKVPAYSTFGHGEIYFPVDIAVQRLSSALSRDIIHLAFLDDDARQEDIRRQMLLATKQFVLSREYRGALDALETENGAPIWQDLSRLNEFQAEGDIHQYLAEHKRNHARFERESLPGFKRALVARGESSEQDLVKLLDSEIDRYIDGRPAGQLEASALLEWSVDYGIGLHAVTLAERPQNFFTELLAAEASLDSKLGLTVDRSQTELILKQATALNSRLADLENTLLLTKTSEVAGMPAERVAGTTAANGATESLQSEHHKLLSESEQTRTEIAELTAMYVSSLVAEQRAANELRYEAKEQARTVAAQVVAEAEQEVLRTADILNHARAQLEERQQQRRQFLVRHFIIYPTVAALLLLLPGLAVWFGLSLAAALTALFWAPSFALVLVAISTAVIYTAVVLYSFVTGINRAVTAARDEVHSLELRLKATQVRLLDARNRQLRLEYDIYAQTIKVETITKLIKTVGNRITEVEATQKALRECRDEFAASHQSALPSSSYMRRSILSAGQIDEFYRRSVADIETLSQTFINEHTPRSRVRRIEIEDFARSLSTFATIQFKFLADLSIQDVLFRYPDLLPAEQASQKLEELERAATPLALLSEMDLNDNTLAQKDVTIWTEPADGAEILHHYTKTNATSICRPSDDEFSVRALTRCLNFPAFYLSQIEFYRSCYERLQDKESATLPDVIPDELTTNTGFRRAFEHLLIGIAIELISSDGDGAYRLVNGVGSVAGATRRQVAEKFVGDYKSQKLYAELCERVAATDSETIYNSLVSFSRTATDLEPFEHEILLTLSQRYHPLR